MAEKWREMTSIEDYEFDPDGKYDGALYNENWEEESIARHPDNIYYLGLETAHMIPEYSMIKIVKRREHDQGKETGIYIKDNKGQQEPAHRDSI